MNKEYLGGMLQEVYDLRKVGLYQEAYELYQEIQEGLSHPTNKIIKERV